MEEPKIVGPCAVCGIPMCSAKVKPPPGAWYDRHLGRRLCVQCYGVHKRQGTLEDFDRTTRPREETFAEWQMIKPSVATREEAAERMGMCLDALDRVRHRVAQRHGKSLREFDPVTRRNG